MEEFHRIRPGNFIIGLLLKLSRLMNNNVVLVVYSQLGQQSMYTRTIPLLDMQYWIIFERGELHSLNLQAVTVSASERENLILQLSLQKSWRREKLKEILEIFN